MLEPALFTLLSSKLNKSPLFDEVSRGIVDTAVISILFPTCRTPKKPNSALLDSGSVEMPGLLGNTSTTSHYGRSRWTVSLQTF